MGLNLLISLERLRDAFRGMRTYNTPSVMPEETRARSEVHVQDGLGNVLISLAADNEIPTYQSVRIHRPSPGRQDCPFCRELPVAAPRVSLVEVAERLGLLRPPGGIVERPAPVHFNAPCRLMAVDAPPERLHGATHCGGSLHCPICAYYQSVAEATDRGWRAERAEPPEAILPIGSDSPLRDSFAFADPAMLGSLWIPITGNPPASSYTAARALEEIRRAADQPNAGLAARYIPVEGPTSPCSACDAQVDPADLFIGKRSGIALCEPCLEIWEKAGRAKRTGEF